MSPKSCSMRSLLWNQFSLPLNDLVCFLILQTKSRPLPVSACWPGDWTVAGGRQAALSWARPVWLRFQKAPTDRAWNRSLLLFVLASTAHAGPHSGKVLQELLATRQAEEARSRAGLLPPGTGQSWPVGDVRMHPVGFCVSLLHLLCPHGPAGQGGHSRHLCALNISIGPFWLTVLVLTILWALRVTPLVAPLGTSHPTPLLGLLEQP